MANSCSATKLPVRCPLNARSSAEETKSNGSKPLQKKQKFPRAERQKTG